MVTSFSRPDPTSLNAQFMVATTIPLKLRRMRVQKGGDGQGPRTFRQGSGLCAANVQPAKTAYYTEPQWKALKAEYEDQLHSTIALVYFNRSDLPKATRNINGPESNPRTVPLTSTWG